MLTKFTPIFLLSIIFLKPAISSVNELAQLQDIFPHISEQCLSAYLRNATEPELQGCVISIDARLKSRDNCQNEKDGVWVWDDVRRASLCLKQQKKT
jgi:hypothetical protein